MIISSQAEGFTMLWHPAGYW